MTNTMKHLSLLGRMETDGLMLSLTGLFSENELDGACEKVERLELQARLKKNRSSQIQRKLVECGEFADLYHALCTCEIEDDRIEPMLKSADDCHESLTQYPTEQVLEAASLNVPTALTFEYLKYYLPYVKYEEEEKAILDNLWLFPVADWKGLSSLTAHQRDMMRFPFLGACLFNWHSNEKETLVLLEQSTPLQKILGLLYQQGVTVFLDSGRLKALQWLRETDIGKFHQLLEVFEHDADDLSIFFQRWFENRAGQYDLNWFIRQEAPLNKEQREEILCNQVSYLNALYAGCLHLDFDAIRSYQFPILVYAVEHRKKHFLQLVDQNSEIFLSLSRYALLFEDCFCEHCNLNSLSEKNLQDCDAAKRTDSYFDCLEEGQQYTFEEMRLLWQQDQIYVRLYAKLTPIPVDQRMLTLRQLLKRDLVSRYTEDEQLTQLAQCLLEQPFSEWYRKRFGHIRGLTRRTAMQMLFHYTQLCPFVPDLQTETDAVFAARNLPLLAGCENWPQVRASVLTTDMDWAQLKESLSISDEFVKQNQNCITDFLLRGGSSLVTPLYNYLQGNDAAIEALRRIVQAELMGQFYVLKYFADDLHREINHPISEQQETAWQKNLALERGKFIAEEADDFYHTIQIGELPYGTCLSYRTGSQRECLLAAFDSNKKIILIRKGDEIVARACIRLTKGAFQKPTELMLSFADLAGENTTESGRIVSEKLVLFLERIYTTGINDDEQQVVMEMAVVLATQKAAELGAVSVLARRYVNCYARDQYVSSPFYVYISKSKNGQQYLDSLGGAATTSRKEKYVEGAFLVERAALHTAGVLPEKEE